MRQQSHVTIRSGVSIIMGGICLFSVSMDGPLAQGPPSIPTLMGTRLNITEVFVNVGAGEITIKGERFDSLGTLDVTLGDFGSLAIIGVPTDTEIVAGLPPEITDGDYLLVVSRGTSQTDKYNLTISSVASSSVPSFVLKDANGSPIGTVVDAADNFAQIDIQFQDAQGATRTVRDFVSAVGFLRRGTLFHATGDCTDSPLMFPRGPFRVAREIQGVIHGLGDVRILHVPSDVTPQSTLILGGSEFNDFGAGPVFTCRDFGSGFTVDMVPTEVLDPDLHTTFPLPYTLELQ
ncbi:hypothetical protein MYX04_09800 [Nitrospiraceae bacterium AH_259_D15_M11_P09]|nr:hypothetical protein [Nitrospiraceae bacterium AH_259_D15_M11_P09]